jgi:membrane-associated protein
MDIVTAVMASPWIYPTLFGFCAADAVFPAVPSETAVMAAAVFGLSGVTNLPLVLAVAAAGAFVGDHVTYAIGRGTLGTRLLRRSRHLSKAVDIARRRLDERGGTMIIASRFIPGGRTAVNLACGSTHYPLARFSKAAAVAAVAWALYTGAIAIVAGTAFAANPLLGVLFGTGMGLAITGVMELVRYLRRRKAAAQASDWSTAELAATEAAPEEVLAGR